MNERRSFSPPAVGASSLLVIFAVLCLTTFALLSIATVQADTRLADQSAQSIAAYYRADSQAEEILAQLRTGQIPPGVTLEDGLYTYYCPISKTQALAVAVRMQGDSYTIECWQAVSTTQWITNDRLPVWAGSESKGETIYGNTD